MGRYAYICMKCTPPLRIFALPGESLPRCPTHGRMERQANHPYMQGSSPLKAALKKREKEMSAEKTSSKKTR